MKLLEKAASQGEPTALSELASFFWGGYVVQCGKPRAEVMWREAAELGDCDE